MVEFCSVIVMNDAVDPAASGAVHRHRPSGVRDQAVRPRSRRARRLAELLRAVAVLALPADASASGWPNAEVGWAGTNW